MPLAVEITRCRSCGSDQLAQVLDLGLFSLSDFLESPDAHTDKAPLVVVRCADCSLVQLRHTVDRNRLYRNYWYRSSTQPAMVSALRDVVAEARERVLLVPEDVVVDVGANDGTLLEQYPEHVTKIAYEPAENLRHELVRKRIRVAGGFFPQMMGGSPTGLTTRAKVITSVACFYDVDDPNAFVEGIKANLADDGVWINQMAYLPATLAMNNYGDFCHEHLTYWTILAFMNLLSRHGMGLKDAEFNSVNGGSVRFIVGHGEHAARGVVMDHVDEFAFQYLAKNASDNKRRLLMLLRSAKRRGEKIIGYGASTKGSTYLQYWGLGPDLLPTIADRNPDKWNKYTPTGQLVISEEQMRSEKPAYLLVLPWHFLDAFMDREKDLLSTGTRMLVPFPDLHIVGGEDASNKQEAA